MREEFYDVYRDLYEIYGRTTPERIWFERDVLISWDEVRRIRRAREAIQGATAELQLLRRLRPDAMHLLLVCLDQMILLPLSHPSVRLEVEEPGAEDLEADVRLILSEAAEKSEEEITGHAIVESVGRIWGELRSTRLEIWG